MKGHSSSIVVLTTSAILVACGTIVVAHKLASRIKNTEDGERNRREQASLLIQATWREYKTRVQSVIAHKRVHSDEIRSAESNREVAAAKVIHQLFVPAVRRNEHIRDEPDKVASWDEILGSFKHVSPLDVPLDDASSMRSEEYLEDSALTAVQTPERTQGDLLESGPREVPFEPSPLFDTPTRDISSDDESSMSSKDLHHSKPSVRELFKDESRPSRLFLVLIGVLVYGAIAFAHTLPLSFFSDLKDVMSPHQIVAGAPTVVQDRVVAEARRRIEWRVLPTHFGTKYSLVENEN